MHPGEKPLPAAGAVRSIAVAYKSASLPLFGWDVHWLVAFFILSIGFGFAFKGLFHVEV